MVHVCTHQRHNVCHMYGDERRRCAILSLKLCSLGVSGGGEGGGGGGGGGGGYLLYNTLRELYDRNPLRGRAPQT